MIYLKRLIKAILYSGISLYYFFHEFSHEFCNHPWSEKILGWAPSTGIGHTAADTLVFAMTITAFVFMLKGVYYFSSLHLENGNPTFDRTLSEMFEGGGISESKANRCNIQRVMSYRDSKMSAMSNSSAASEYRQTAWINGYIDSDCSSVQSAVSYIDSKLGAMSNEQGYNWLKNF